MDDRKEALEAHYWPHSVLVAVEQERDALRAEVVRAKRLYRAVEKWRDQPCHWTPEAAGVVVAFDEIREAHRG